MGANRSCGITSSKYNTSVNGFQKFFDFLTHNFFGSSAFFDPSHLEERSKKGQSQKKLLKRNIRFFMPVNYEKEFLKSIHTGVVFWELFSRASIGPHYSRSWNFQLRMSLCSVFQHVELKFQGYSWIWDNRFALLSTLKSLLQLCQMNMTPLD